jgi:hypothetical protein
MGVSPRVVAWLRNGGHDAMHLRDQQLQRMADGDIVAKAQRYRASVWSEISLMVVVERLRRVSSSNPRADRRISPRMQAYAP